MNLPEDYHQLNIEAAAEIWIMDCLAHCCELIADERPDLFDWFMSGEGHTGRLGGYHE